MFKDLNEKSFTLIELLVVISIIILITTSVFLNYRAGQNQLALQRSASKLTQDIRRTEGMAMSAKLCEICSPKIVPPGYGIYLKQGDNYYSIYADNNPSQGNEIYDDGQDTIVETIYLESKVYIKDVQPASLSINFKPPDPKTKISGAGGEFNSATIILSLETDPTREEKIIINKAGLIYVE